jgi:tetratricopeptide (TPR) repeat protein
VEALVYEGFLSKRVREEGGGYRFVFQTVAEYLIYSHLAEERRGQEVLAYWQRRAEPGKVFPEYARAFSFLLRDLAASGKLEEAALLVEASPDWVCEALIGILVEQARSGDGSGVPGVAATSGAYAFSRKGALKCAAALHDAGFQLRNTRFVKAAIAYLEGCVELCETLRTPNNLDSHRILMILGHALSVLGGLQEAGRTEEAEHTHRRAVEISEALWQSRPGDPEVAGLLGMTHNRLALVLHKEGRTGQAEGALRRAVHVLEGVWVGSSNINIGHTLACVLNDLGIVLIATGRASDAEELNRRAADLFERLWAGSPHLLHLGEALGRALAFQGQLLRISGRNAEAEQPLRRAVEILESIRSAKADDVHARDGLTMALIELGMVQDAAGRHDEAERTYWRSVEMYDRLGAADPGDIHVGQGLAFALIQLGAYARAVGVYKALCAANPDNFQIHDKAETLLLVMELMQVPQHDKANELKQYLENRRSQG